MIRRKKNVKKGIQFCLMACGASGTGMSHRILPSPRPKSLFYDHHATRAQRVCTLPADTSYLPTGRTTFVNTLCGKDVLQHKDSDDATDAHVEDGVKIKPVTVGAWRLLPALGAHPPADTTELQSSSSTRREHVFP